jgi:thioredoxin 1
VQSLLQFQVQFGFPQNDFEHNIRLVIETMTIPSITPGQVVHCSNEDDYDDILRLAGDKLVVVDCFAEWCPPCKAIAPVFEALAREHSQVVFLKVDVDQMPSIKAILNVWAMPTFAFLKHGSKVGSFVGAKESMLRYGIQHDGNVGMCASCNIM